MTLAGRGNATETATPGAAPSTLTSPIADRHSSASATEGEAYGEGDGDGDGEVDDDETDAFQEDEQPGKKRKRYVKISCELCKARKVKCDRAEPACGWCASHDRPCVYKERQKPGLRVGYGRELEEKINRLEALLQHMGRRLEDHIAVHGDGDPAALPGPAHGQAHAPDHAYTNSHAQAHGQAPAPAPPAPGRSQSSPYAMYPSSHDQHPSVASRASHDTPMSDARWSSSTTTTYSPGAYPRPPDAMSIRSVLDNYNGNPHDVRPRSNTATTSTLWQPSTAPSLSISDADLPPPDLAYTLVDLYFKHINPWCPILDRKSIFDAFFGPAPTADSDRILLYAVVAAALRFSNDLRLTAESKAQFVETARQKIVLYAMDHPNVRVLQALLIIAVDVLGTSNGQPGWNLLALLARNIVQLGLDKEQGGYLQAAPYRASAWVPVSQPTTWIESEGRRRLCWMTFALDRYATVGTADTFVLDEREMDRCLPCRYDSFSRNEPAETRWRRRDRPAEMIVNNPENLGTFSYHCEILGILSRIHRFLHEPLDLTRHTDIQRWRDTYQELDVELNTWIKNLPRGYGSASQLCHSDPGSRVSNWIMLQAAFIVSVVRLHSAAAYPTVKSPYFTPSHQAIERCIGAVESLRQIADSLRSTGHLGLLGHPFAFSLWVSACLLLVHAATMECDVDPNIHHFMSFLDEMGLHWPVARDYHRTLVHVVDEGSTRGSDMTYPMMRRTAFDLSVLVSQRPQSTLDPTSVHHASERELEYLKVFDFFNYPRLNTTGAPAFVIPNPESDWFRGSGEA